MTEEELTTIYNLLLEEYGENLPNPEHEPFQFVHLVKLHLYYNSNKTS